MPEQLEQPIPHLERRAATLFRIGAAAQAPGDLGPELELDPGQVVVQRLGIGVGGHELDAAQPRLDHVVERVAPAASHAHHLDGRPHVRGPLELEQLARLIRPVGQQLAVARIPV